MMNLVTYSCDLPISFRVSQETKETYSRGGVNTSPRSPEFDGPASRVPSPGKDYFGLKSRDFLLRLAGTLKPAGALPEFKFHTSAWQLVLSHDWEMGRGGRESLMLMNFKAVVNLGAADLC